MKNTILLILCFLCSINTKAQNGEFSTGKITIDSISYRVTPARISAYIVTPAPTTITNAGDYYFVQGIFTNENTASFGFTGDTLQYQNGDYRHLIGDYKFSLSTNGTNITVSIAIYINDTKLLMSEETVLCKVNGEMYHLSGNIMFEAMTNDKIKIMVTCDSAGKQVTISKGSTTLHEIP